MSSKETRIFYDTDADPARLQNRVVAVIGYGSQGHAHALNLRDSGVGARVVVGLRPGGGSWERARAEGLDVRPVADAARAADVIMMLVPDQEARAVYEAGVAGALRAGKTLLFAHGFNVHFKEIVPPAEVDVAMIAPKSPGHLVRSEFQAGRGVPGPAHRERQGQGRDATATARDSERRLRARMDRRDPRRRAPLRRVPPRRCRSSDRARRRPAARHDAVDGGGEGSASPPDPLSTT